MSKLQGFKNGDTQSCTLSTRNVFSMDTCNAATQTEKVLSPHVIEFFDSFIILYVVWFFVLISIIVIAAPVLWLVTTIIININIILSLRSRN